MKKLKVGQLIEAGLIDNVQATEILENEIVGVNTANLEEVKGLISGDTEKLTVEKIKEIAGEEDDKDPNGSDQSEDKPKDSAEPKGNETKQEQKTGSDGTVTMSESNFNKLMDKFDKMEKRMEQLASNKSQGQGQQVKTGHEIIENRANKAYGVRFFDVDFLKNSIDNVEVKLSKKDRETDFYGVINGTKSTFNFTAFVIGDNICVDFDTSNISPKTQKAIFSVLVNKVKKASELLSE